MMNMFSKILRKEQAKPLDPRPDLVDDAHIWEAVFQTVKRVYGDDSDICGLLHGMRCGGARIERKLNGRLHLDYSPVLTHEPSGAVAWEREHIRDNWLMPAIKQIHDVFMKSATILGNPQPEVRKAS